MLKMSVMLFPCLILFLQCKETRVYPTLTPPILGEWYEPGDSISFIWNSGERSRHHDRLSCTMEQNGLVLYYEEFNEKEMISLPIPGESRSGLINVICQSLTDENKNSLSRVYYLEEPPGSLSLSYYPPVPMAGSIVEASCSAEHISRETWYRWYLEDQLLGEGYLKDQGDRILFYGPGKKGNYTLTVELYPARPILQGETSPHSGSIEIFFDDMVDQDGTLVPEDWQSLFYCDGTNIDRGRPFVGLGRGKALGFLSSSNLSPQIVEGDRGYGFTSDSYLKYDGKILQGQGSAFALIQTRMVLHPPRGGEGKDGTLQIFNSTDGRRDNSYSLFIKEGQLLFSLGQDAKFVRSHLDFPSSLDGVPFWLSLVIEQRGEDLLIRWYLDDILRKEDRIKSFLLPHVFIGGGSTTWGRGNYPSFEGILLEWGFNGEPGEIIKFEKDMNYVSR